MVNNWQLSQDEYNTIHRLVYDSVGINLTETKKAMVVSRLNRRLQALNINSFQEYLDLLNNSPAELNTMLNLLTTNVTSFFREAHHFDYLRQTHLPGLEDHILIKRLPRKITVWSAGCSTGEEPYTLAMVLHNFFKNKSGWRIKIWASDVNTSALNKGREGIYTKENVANIPYGLLKTYFKLGTGPNSGYFKVKDLLKNLIHYCQINLNNTSEYPGEPLNFIFCRNVFIYFDRNTQDKVLNAFHSRLIPEGLVFLGHSESINARHPDQTGKWRPLKHTIYKRIP